MEKKVYNKEKCILDYFRLKIRLLSADKLFSPCAHHSGTNDHCRQKRLAVSILEGAKPKAEPFTGCRNCKAPGTQAYGYVLQMPGEAADAVPCECLPVRRNG